ncbi:GNAT family N-acetyltransferase [Ancylobacter pratisalsi]|uniref:GNAT family N-acetyltransferase n=1 Tax=Ancylobacter pratisalsi TaxID=1745854 RepID=A0A6P1YKD4_9HYPH|nr:GNAT family N-acetyltransferase [Ancylobacter pratisalsi]QIB33769.1 GNAT family N-acetyltransferase [Ancylobacter pratisalsi]
MVDLVIRPAADADADGDAIAELMALAFAEYEGCIFDRAAEFPELDAIASHFAARNGAIWVAELDGAVVGSLAIAPSRDAGRPPGAMEITKVYVARAVRRRGVARALFTRALALAEQRGAPQVHLWTDTRFVDAHRFYESCGFERSAGARELRDLSATWEYPYCLALSTAASPVASLEN